MSVDSDIEIKGSLISYFSNLVKKNGGINLAQGIPGFMPPQELIESLSEVSFKNYHQYAPGTGNAYIISFLESRYRIAESDSKILITNGATEAISLIYNYLMSVIESDSFNVAAFSPAYESYIHLPRIFGHGFWLMNPIFICRASLDTGFSLIKSMIIVILMKKNSKLFSNQIILSYSLLPVREIRSAKH
jgi:hypothetical protein